MMSRNQPRPTKEEAQRMKIIKRGGCMLTWLKFGEYHYAEVHHILIGGKRAGHWYTIPLSPWYHRAYPDLRKTPDEMRAKYGASLADGTRAFVSAHHYTELELWQKLQVLLGLDDSLPPTKIIPRRGYADTNKATGRGDRDRGSNQSDDIEREGTSSENRDRRAGQRTSVARGATGEGEGP